VRPKSGDTRPVPQVINGAAEDEAASLTTNWPLSMAAARVVELLGAPAAELMGGRSLRVARRYSLCDDDAAEALSRAFEIAIEYRGRVRPEKAAAWFATVVRHEAIRIRRARLRELSLDTAEHETSTNDHEPAREPDPRLPALRAAMRHLTPDQRRALLLYGALDAGRRNGGRYHRIAAATGWSYTKVNRCLAEGRAALRALLIDKPPAT
jgi:DNA-directed RNA polymerase specialized sigma24 family protein